MIRTSHASGSEAADFSFDVQVPAEWHYSVRYEAGATRRFGAIFEEAFGDAAAVVLTDERVRELYGERLKASFAASGRRPHWIVLESGEPSKSLATFATVLGELERRECSRRTVLVNFGGGVISDVGGFAASAYMRGIPYANLSTSLLGQVDACVGGKVAVNSDHAKNLIGAFYHPRLVVGDTELLGSLSARDFRSGIAEGIKVAIICSPALFGVFEGEHERIRSGDPDCLARVIGTAAKLKMDLIAQDPYEADLRRPLNFGHTIGHPIETELGYRHIRHGEAVAVGMGIATLIAQRKGWIQTNDAQRILHLLERYDLLGCPAPVDPQRVMEHVRYVRLVRERSLNFVLPTGIGRVRIAELDDSELVAGFEEYEGLVGERAAP